LYNNFISIIVSKSINNIVTTNYNATKTKSSAKTLDTLLRRDFMNKQQIACTYMYLRMTKEIFFWDDNFFVFLTSTETVDYCNFCLTTERYMFLYVWNPILIQ
jgi:hypothetical protein